MSDTDKHALMLPNEIMEIAKLGIASMMTANLTDSQTTRLKMAVSILGRIETLAVVGPKENLKYPGQPLPIDRLLGYTDLRRVLIDGLLKVVTTINHTLNVLNSDTVLHGIQKRPGV